MTELHTFTGGSYVKNGVWRSCDFPLRDEYGMVKPEQLRAERWLGTYLLAKGLANQCFTYFRFQDILVIQSRRYWSDPVSEHILKTSLIKLLADYPEERFNIRVPGALSFKRRIRDLVLFALDGLVNTSPMRLTIR